jgi:hypothetical protein
MEALEVSRPVEYCYNLSKPKRMIETKVPTKLLIASLESLFLNVIFGHNESFRSVCEARESTPELQLVTLEGFYSSGTRARFYIITVRRLRFVPRRHNCMILRLK